MLYTFASIRPAVFTIIRVVVTKVERHDFDFRVLTKTGMALQCNEGNENTIFYEASQEFLHRQWYIRFL
jgi:hypothetical protein